MKFLPIENIVYKSSLKEDELIERLAKQVEFRNTFINHDSRKFFEGQIVNNKFEIERKINYRNSFLPKILGAIETDTDGTKIYVNMKLNVFAKIFSIIWCGFMLLLGIVLLSKNIFELQPFYMIVFLYIMTMVFFKFESIKSKELLQNIFEAEIISE